jgi:hypothetical protein
MRRILCLAVGCLGLCLLQVGCGEGDQAGTRARNLATGEIQTFAGAVPEGFAPCTDTDCTVAPTLPCEKLGTAVCPLHPDCRLKVLWCTGTGVISTPGAPAPAPIKDTCEYGCIPKLPLLCEELGAEKDCLARKDCEWGLGACPACVGPACTCKPTCHVKPVPPPPVPPLPPPVPAGCKSSKECASTELCLFKTGCGALGPGACVAKPQACPMYFAPVCGCDGKTYGNECEARATGASIAHVGACNLPPPTPAGCKSNADCGKSELCLFKSGCGKLGVGSCVARPQACPMYYSPVCGCDGNTYSNECDAFGAGVSVAAPGQCNVKPDPATCSAIAQKYTAALQTAKDCNPMSLMPVMQCGFEVKTGLGCPICSTFVNDVTQLNAIEKDWLAQGCDKLQYACPAIACQAPKSGVCSSVAGTKSGGRCQDVK